MKTIEEYNADKKMEDYTDSFGLVGNQYMSALGTKIDGGDSLQRTGMIGIAYALKPDVSVNEAAALRFRYLEMLSKHRIGPGLYVRHPGGGFASNLNTTSGDQLRPNIIALGLFGEYKLVWQIFWRLLCRGGFYWNTRDTGDSNVDNKKMPDWSGPEHWAMYMRALWPAMRFFGLPLILLGDLVGVVATWVAAVPYARERIRNCDQLNRISMLIQAQESVKTPLSMLSNWIFKRFRPTYKLFVHEDVRYWQDWYGYHQDYKTNPPNVCKYILDSYFWSKNDPPINKVWESVAAKYFQS